MESNNPRETCWDCFRPVAECYCRWIPKIENQTEIVILQHRREKFHPFNTARIVNRALMNSQLKSGRVDELESMVGTVLNPGSVLLYPGPNAQSIDELPSTPEQIVVLDGTWHHAKAMFRDIKQLQALPQIKINPKSPGQYRIRQEPNDFSLATVEATLAALREIEPETPGLSGLTEAFHGMIDRQVAHTILGNGWKHLLPRDRSSINFPIAIIRDLENVVVVYGESAGRERELRDFVASSNLGPNINGHEGKYIANHGQNRLPVYWVAERIGTGETFVAAIHHGEGCHAEDVLKHLELSELDFEDTISFDEFRANWLAFVRPTDSLAAFHSSTFKLLENVGIPCPKYLSLKSVNLPDAAGVFSSNLEHFIRKQGVDVNVKLPGRAGRRLANAVYYARYLHDLALSDFEKKTEDRCRPTERSPEAH